MSSGLHVVRAGVGPALLLIHGSATDHTAWMLQLRLCADQFAMTAYDRRHAPTVEAEAAGARSLVTGPTILVGSSYGAVIALEVLRTNTPGVVGAVMIEPPMAASDAGSAAPAQFLADFDRIVETEGGPAAGAFFLRTVLGDAAWDRVPQAFRDRSAAKWREIRADCGALLSYRPRYAELRDVAAPVLLLGGERSGPLYRPTLDALAAALPRARLEMVPNAGHMLHAEAPKRFAELLAAFARETC